MTKPRAAISVVAYLQAHGWKRHPGSAHGMPDCPITPCSRRGRWYKPGAPPGLGPLCAHHAKARQHDLEDLEGAK